MLTLTTTLFHFALTTSTTSIALSPTYLFECLHSPLFANASLLAKLVSVAISSGLNTTALTLVISLLNLFSTNSSLIYPTTAVLIRLSPALQSTAIAQHHTICLSSIALYNLSAILDMAFTSLTLSLGSLGIKVVILN
jgi:hypothetical protein